jgi:chromate transporter
MSDAPPPGPRVTLAELFLAYNAITFAAFGGGISGWALDMLVRRKAWLSEEEFLAAMMLARIFPGANQANLAVFVGRRLRGLPGAIAAVAGLTALPLLLFLAAGFAYQRYGSIASVAGGLKVMASIAAGVAFATGLRAARPYVRKPVPILLALSAFGGMALLHLPLLLVVGALAPLGLAWAWRAGA